MAFAGIGAANLVSLVRMFAVFAVVGLLFQPGPNMYTLALISTALIIWADGLDGYLARKLGESSPVGALVDILSDRVVELVYWIAFATLGWVPLWVPLVVMTRGIWVDGFRSLALKEGETAFGGSTMMKTWWGVLLVSSRFSRYTYAVTKALAFVMLIAAYHPHITWPGLHPLALITTYVSVGFCVVRGLPVLLEGMRYLKPALKDLQD
jgi:phosphatidylglycerophosphate synthase